MVGPRLLLLLVLYGAHWGQVSTLKRTREPPKSSSSHGAAVGWKFPFQLCHVGKCAGSTTKSSLEDAGFRFNEVHGIPLTAASVLNRTTIVTVRDPVARSISAFNWRHPQGGGIRLRKAGSHRWSEVEFYRCFQNVTDWVMALRTTGLCGELARSAISGNCSRLREFEEYRTIRRHDCYFGHISMGFRFYFSNVTAQLVSRSARFWVVHVESLPQDLVKVHGALSRLYSLAGSSPGSSTAGHNESLVVVPPAAPAASSRTQRFIHSAYTRNSSEYSALAPAVAAVLRYHLREEYRFYSMLEAANSL